MPQRGDLKKILILGSGPIVIGQACEFDYSGTQACKALRKAGYEIILINSNPASIMTDPEIANKTYIEPLTPEIVSQIIPKENFKEFTFNFLGMISSKPKKSLKIIKNLVNSEENLKKSLKKERQEFYKLLDSENKKIGIKSFLNKTKPNWK